ncbi:MAG: carbamoyl-phosphate synthase large subunit, partial [Bacteroidales bacterium]|nr:carbamoyl-phosphate synthase large subunit [Bacteroidales bacterium]
SSMKSVGEVMAIGRTFEEAIQKGLRMIGQGAHGFVGNKELKVADVDLALREPTDRRIFVISKAMHQAGYTVDQIHELTKIDKWFLDKLENIVTTFDDLATYSKIEDVPYDLLLTAKQQGFSDLQIQRAIYKDSCPSVPAQDKVRAWRKSLGILPVVKQIDTLAAEFPAATNYLYLTYNGTANDITFENDGKSVIVLGSGAYRIGSSVEFDWCSVTCIQTIQQQGYRGVLINYNPETVSTDYDMCDRLYFDELTFERVMDIFEMENPHGVVVSVGGQIPNNLALRLSNNHVPILGTRAEDIDHAEDRHKFSSIVDALEVDQPRWKELTTLEDVDKFIEEVGFPVLVRPSYVLSGAAMNVCYDEEKLRHFLSLAADVSKEHPVVISQFMTRCKEIEFDAVADDGEILAYAISEHVEYAGVHSGDATIQFPPQRLYVETARRIKKIARKIAGALRISGPFNIQFLAKENEIKVIECNLRASRSFPFVSKVLKINFIELATKVMLGMHPAAPQKSAFDLDYVGVKSSQFSFARLEEADPMLGVDMSSTGEVGCLGDDLNEALIKATLSVGNTIPKKKILLSTGDPLQKADMLTACKLLASKGYELYATGGTYKYFIENSIPCTRVLWPSECDNPNFSRYRPALELIQNKEVEMVINIPKNFSGLELNNGYILRRNAIDFNIPLFTNARLAVAFIKAFCTLDMEDIQIKSWDEY